MKSKPNLARHIWPSIFFLIVVLVPRQTLKGQNTPEFSYNDAISTAYGGSQVAQPSTFSLFFNPAIYIPDSLFSIGFSYATPAIGSGLFSASAAGVICKQSTVFGFGFNRFGYEVTHRNTFYLTASQSLSKTARGGISMQATNWNTIEDQRRFVNASMSFVNQFKKWSYAIIMKNLVPSNQMHFKTSFTFGAGYPLTENVRAFFQTFFDNKINPSFQIGISHSYNKQLVFYGGVSANPRVMSFGLSFTFRDKQRLTLGNCLLNILGNTSAVSWEYLN